MDAGLGSLDTLDDADPLQQLREPIDSARLHFRNEMETGPGGKQIQLEDPDGNAIELFEPARSTSP